MTLLYLLTGWLCLSLALGPLIGLALYRLLHEPEDRDDGRRSL